MTFRYVKKARGKLVGKCSFDANLLVPGDARVPVEIRDETGDAVPSAAIVFIPASESPPIGPPGYRRVAARIAVSSAEAIDRELEDVSGELVHAIESLGDKFRPYRSIHRKLHLDDIEGVLMRRRGTA